MLLPVGPLPEREGVAVHAHVLLDDKQKHICSISHSPDMCLILNLSKLVHSIVPISVKTVAWLLVAAAEISFIKISFLGILRI